MQCSSGWTSVMHNQNFTNDSECSGMTGTRIKFKILMLAYRTANSRRLSTSLLPLTITNLHPLQKSEIRLWGTFRGTITERLKITFQNILVHCSWLVEWSTHPYPEGWISDNFQVIAENSSLSTLLDLHFDLKKKLCLSLYVLFLPFLVCTYLNNAWNLLLRALPVSAFASLRRIALCIPNCKSLWIKVSAKWINVNVYEPGSVNTALAPIWISNIF